MTEATDAAADRRAASLRRWCDLIPAEELGATPPGYPIFEVAQMVASILTEREEMKARVAALESGIAAIREAINSCDCWDNDGSPTWTCISCQLGALRGDIE